MSFFVYILYSSEYARTYVGQAENVDVRLRRHNAGFVRSTKEYRPWTLIHSESFQTRSEAIQREAWLKTVSGRRFISKLLDNASVGGGLSDSADAESRSRSAIGGTD